MFNLSNTKTGKGLWLSLQFTPCWFHARHRWQSSELPCYTAQDTGYGSRFTCSKLIKKGIQETCRQIHNHSNNGGVLENGRFASGIVLNLLFKYLPFKCRACSLSWSCHVSLPRVGLKIHLLTRYAQPEDSFGKVSLPKKLKMFARDLQLLFVTHTLFRASLPEGLSVAWRRRYARRVEIQTTCSYWNSH